MFNQKSEITLRKEESQLLEAIDLLEEEEPEDMEDLLDNWAELNSLYEKLYTIQEQIRYYGTN